MDTNKLPEDKEALTKLYNETVDHHRGYLNKIQEAFHNKCDEIRDNAKAELEKTEENDTEGKQKVAKDQKELLDNVLAELKYAITRSNKDAMETIEAITEKMETESLDLESALNTI